MLKLSTKEIISNSNGLKLDPWGTLEVAKYVGDKLN